MLLLAVGSVKKGEACGLSPAAVFPAQRLARPWTASPASPMGHSQTHERPL